MDTEVLYRAIAYHDYKWPAELTSGVLFFEGELITVKDFMEAVKLFKGCCNE